MKVLKKINNNVAICIDDNERELIAFGRGIGFPKIPYILDDLSLIDRTYYGVDSKYFDLLNVIPEEVISVSIKIVEYARNVIHCELSPNILFTLADHINFAIERCKKNILIKSPLFYDIENMYEEEVEVSKYAIKLIEKQLKIHLPSAEITSIALNLINAEERYEVSNVDYESDEVINDITLIVERSIDIRINRKSFNYSRFATHLEYLLRRKEKNRPVSSENLKMFESMREEFPETYACVVLIKDYFKKELNWNPNDEELLYLMLHINRLCTREDCNQ
ncbi:MULTISPECIES: PRD domain-containing protein [unclassified Breznakia]|uniref:PRD domain-containing protein n=1 Tax=unclassified Breznakia TaxID=2623764 RepID=UPI0024761F7F|nr:MULTISPECIES: PRD domain-containing protein [unclassified Breznakia]MDH6366981.1 beta-glucoside operon transcriptional antiterminator [Breznakia sp. PH1-1]MDH6404247.1 beta-glucoside operon transcriptional antiterminator [Breznakia sp. PF1-11]MDH6411868.1 beta-glucoside operon transcriptional antiterminator [Breznakia sp. PFB1-11]MDH6414235.1 beta-glucoside operon transcriptional antiterminator [Breznakia sp. PFB1-14]MDH6415941.1 beta-glucoside operon transcriptional antiterminator [Breznak